MTTKKEIIDAAFAYVYTDFEEYVRDIAREHTIANMGQSLEWLIQSPASFEKRPQDVIKSCYHGHADDCAGEGVDMDDEYRDWLKDARRDATKVQKKKLPLTMANARDAFEKKGVFAKKTK